MKSFSAYCRKQEHRYTPCQAVKYHKEITDNMNKAELLNEYFIFPLLLKEMYGAMPDRIQGRIGTPENRYQGRRRAGERKLVKIRQAKARVIHTT